MLLSTPKFTSYTWSQFQLFYLFISIFISFKMNLNGARFFSLCLLQISPFSSLSLSLSLFSWWAPTSSSLSSGHMKVFHSNWHYRICCKTTFECVFDFKVRLLLSPCFSMTNVKAKKIVQHDPGMEDENFYDFLKITTLELFFLLPFGFMFNKFC